MKKQLLLLLSLMLLMGATGVRAAEAYAYYVSDDGSLNFCYDNNKSYYKNIGYDIYSLNTGSNVPAWDGIATSVKWVYFMPSFANYRPTTCYRWFYNMTNLTKISYIERLNTSSVTNMGLMFCWCKKLASLDVSGFNTSKVTNMQSMFEDDYSLTSLNVSNWDTSKVSNMAGMFYGCKGLTTLNVANWNTSSCTTMRYLFYECTNLTTLDVYNWKTILVTSMYCMFGNCYKLETVRGLTSLVLGIQNFVTTNVTTMEGMFKNCYKLNQLWLDNFLIGSSATTTNMLQGCSGLQHLSLSDQLVNYLNANACSGVGTASSPCTMIYSTSVHPSFTTVTPDYVVWKSGYFKSQNMKPYAVYYNNALTFYYDDYFKSRSGSNYELNTGTNTPGWNSYRSSIQSVTFNSNFTNARPTTCYEWFSGMSNLTSVSNVSYLNTSKVTNMAYMFKGCSSLTYLDLNWSSVTTGNVTKMGYMFYGCSKLATLYIGNFNTANVTDFGYMFYGCSSLTSVSVSQFNTAKATYMAGMFYNCSKLTSINVSSWNTANAKSWLDSMFDGCSSLTSLDLSSFTIGSGNYMMGGCSSLTYLKVPSSGNSLTSTACNGVGTASKPCVLDHPDGFTPTNIQEQGDGYFKWKNGYFKDILRPYAVLNGSTLTFYYDKQFGSRTGTSYEMNYGASSPRWHDYANSVQTVKFDSSFANARPTSTYYWFDSMSNLTTISNINYLNTSEVTNMAYMFWGCSKLTSVNVSNWNTAKTTNMQSLFSSCTSLSSITGLTNLNTSKVTNMAFMFYNCKQLASIDISKFTLSSSVSTGDMFNGCTALKTLTIPNTANILASAACSGVGSQSNPCTLIYPSGFTPDKTSTGNGWYVWKGGYFKDDGELKAYAVLNGSTLTFYYDRSSKNRTGTPYDLNTGTNTPGWNAKATSVKKVVFDSSFEDARPTTCYKWFAGMTNLTTIDLGYLDTSNATNMASMFLNCSSLTSLNLSEAEGVNFNTTKVTTMNSMFKGCSKLTELRFWTDNFYDFETGIPNYWGGISVGKVTNMAEMFSGCSSLEEFILPDFKPTASANVDNMFKNCTAANYLYVDQNLTNSPSTLFTGLGTTSNPVGYANPNYEPDGAEYVSNYFKYKGGYFRQTIGEPFVVVEYGSMTFRYGNPHAYEWSLPDYDVYSINYGTTAPEWSSIAANITNVEFDKSFQKAHPTSCYKWFNGMSKITSIEGIEYLNTEFVTNMTSMFQGCSSLTEIGNLGAFNTKKVTTMYRMFYGCTKLKTLDLSSGDTSTNGGIPLYGFEFTTEKVTNMKQMFYNCKALTSLVFPGLAVSASTAVDEMFKNCTALNYLLVQKDLSAAPSTTFSGIGTTTKPCELYSYFLPEDVEIHPTYMIWKSGYFKEKYRTPYAVINNGTLSFCYTDYMMPTEDYYSLNSGSTAPEWLEKATSVTKVVFGSSFKYVFPTSCYRWFYGMTKLASITGWDNLNTSEVTNMTSMFNNCKKLTNLDLSKFTFKSGVTTGSMLKNCSGLKKLTIPASAKNLNDNACSGVGTTTAPCELVYPSGFTPVKQETGNGWYMWKSGYFKEDSSYQMGDVNHDGSVTIIDVTLTVDYVLGQNPPNFYIENADMTGEGDITVSDVSLIVEIVMSSSASNAPSNAREAMMDRLWLTAKGNSCLLHADNHESYNAMHVTLRLPEGASMGNVRLASNRSNNHQVVTRPLGDGRYNVVVFANNNSVLRDGETPLLHFDVAGCQPDDVSVEALQAANTFFETVMLPVDGTLTGITQVESDDSDAPYYNTVGVRTKTPTRGVYINQGRKVVVK